MSTTGDWARFYVVKRNWAITPLHTLENGVCTCVNGVACGDNAGKHPVKGGWTDPSTMLRTEEQVTEFYRSRYWNIGLPTGQINLLVALDIDPRNGGFNSLDELESMRPGGPLPRTLTAHTGGGGRHLIYGIPAGVSIKKGPLHKDLPGIDIQADGAQIVLPPSLHKSGIRYTWADESGGALQGLTPLPDDLLDLLTTRRSGGGGGGKVNLDQIMSDGFVPKGERNHALYAYACRQARRVHVDTANPGSDLDNKIRELTAAVIGWNLTFCRPPLEQDEVLGRVQAATDWVRKTPGAGLDPEQEQWLIARRDDPKGLGSDGPEDGPEDPATADLTNDDAPEDGPGGDDPPPPDRDSVVSGTPGNRTLTENGNARRIVDYFGVDLRYTPNIGWYTWAGGHWLRDDEELFIVGKTRDLPPLINPGESTTNSDSGGLQDWATRSRASANIRKSVSLAESDPRVYVPSSAWDANDLMLGCANGVIDLQSGRLYPPDRSQYITKRAAITYDPTARDTRWELFMDQVTRKDRDFQAWLQRAAGYTLTGLTLEEKMFLVYGPKASGKSTFGALLAKMLGEYSFEMSADMLLGKRGASAQDDYATAQLYGRRMLFVSEMPDAERMKEDLVKRMVGDVRMQGRHPGKDHFVFDMKAKLWIATNHRPRVDDDALWRRLLAIPFMFENLAPQTDLKPWLLSPTGGLPAVLAWSVKGAVDYLARRSLGTCEAVETATREYKANEDRLAMFFDEMTRPVEGGEVAVQDLWRSSRVWYEARGEEGYKTRARFEKTLLEKGYEILGRGSTAAVPGVALKPIDTSRPNLAQLSAVASGVYQY